MTIVLTWHLILMFIITVVFVIWMFSFDSDAFSFLAQIPIFLLLVLIWAVYGGINWW